MRSKHVITITLPEKTKKFLAEEARAHRLYKGELVGALVDQFHRCDAAEQKKQLIRGLIK